MKAALAATAALGVIVAAAPALAHHSFAMFDRSKIETYVGRVEEYEWAAPHVHVRVTLDGARSREGVWDFEGPSSNIMARLGWSKTSYKPGDRITVVAHPGRTRTIGLLQWAVRSDGSKMYAERRAQVQPQ